jgi:hypothetical protein
MIITVDDIKRKSDNGNDYETVELPFWLEWFYNKKNKRLSLYNKQTDIVKQSWLTHREASCIIFWIITLYREIQSELFEFWLIE